MQYYKAALMGGNDIVWKKKRLSFGQVKFLA